jgi:hypothetical protein
MGSPVTGSSKHDIDPWGSMKDGDILDKLSGCRLLKDESFSWS